MFIDQVMDDGFSDDPLDLPVEATPSGKENSTPPISPDSLELDEFDISLPTPSK